MKLQNVNRKNYNPTPAFSSFLAKTKKLTLHVPNVAHDSEIMTKHSLLLFINDFVKEIWRGINSNNLDENDYPCYKQLETLRTKLSYFNLNSEHDIFMDSSEQREMSEIIEEKTTLKNLFKLIGLKKYWVEESTKKVESAKKPCDLSRFSKEDQEQLTKKIKKQAQETETNHQNLLDEYNKLTEQLREKVNKACSDIYSLSERFINGAKKINSEDSPSDNKIEELIRNGVSPDLTELKLIDVINKMDLSFF